MSDSLPAVRSGQPIELRAITPETPIAIKSSGREYLVSARDILEWVAPQAPISEAKKHLVICQMTGLNPLLGEIDLLLFGGKWQTVFRKNGYLKCARDDKNYDGHESGVTVQAFETNPKGQKIKTGPLLDILGTLVPDGHLLVGGWCKLYRRGISRPFYKRVSFQEYGKSVPGPWQSIPCTMIEKVAIAHACREAIDLLAGTYDESEIDRGYENASRPAAPRPVAATVVATEERTGIFPILPPREDRAGLIPMMAPGPYLSPENPAPQAAIDEINAEPEVVTANPAIEPATQTQIDEIGALVKKVDMPPAAYAAMLERRGVLRLDDLSFTDAAGIIHKLNHVASRLDFDPLGDKDLPAPDPAPEPDATTATVE